jgi:hypothetical protein
MSPAIQVDLLKRLLDAAALLRERLADGEAPPKVELEIAASRLTEAADVIAAMHSGSKVAA